MRIVICEDDALYRRSLYSKIELWMKETNNYDIDILMFHSSEELLERWNNGLSAHLLLLDIEIPNELNGMLLAQIIRQTDPEIPIVFITNYDDYVYQGYVIRALRYIKKPIVEADLYPCLEIAYHHYTLLHQDCSVLSVPGKRIVLRYAEIIYIEAQSPNTIIYTTNLDSPIRIRYQFSKIIELLPQTLFTPCHRSYIVNLSKIRILKKNQIVLSNNLVLPVSEKYVNMVFESFNYFHQERSNML